MSSPAQTSSPLGRGGRADQADHADQRPATLTYAIRRPPPPYDPAVARFGLDRATTSPGLGALSPFEPRPAGSTLAPRRRQPVRGGVGMEPADRHQLTPSAAGGPGQVVAGVPAVARQHGPPVREPFGQPPHHGLGRVDRLVQAGHHRQCPRPPDVHGRHDPLVARRPDDVRPGGEDRVAVAPPPVPVRARPRPTPCSARRPPRRSGEDAAVVARVTVEQRADGPAPGRGRPPAHSQDGPDRRQDEPPARRACERHAEPLEQRPRRPRQRPRRGLFSNRLNVTTSSVGRSPFPPQRQTWFRSLAAESRQKSSSESIRKVGATWQDTYPCSRRHARRVRGRHGGRRHGLPGQTLSRGRTPSPRPARPPGSTPGHTGRAGRR